MVFFAPCFAYTGVCGQWGRLLFLSFDTRGCVIVNIIKSFFQFFLQTGPCRHHVSRTLFSILLQSCYNPFDSSPPASSSTLKARHDRQAILKARPVNVQLARSRDRIQKVSECEDDMVGKIKNVGRWRWLSS
jgi:hypothetical protein